MTRSRLTSSQRLQASSRDRSNLLSVITTLVLNLHAHTRHVITVRIASLPKARRKKCRAVCAWRRFAQQKLVAMEDL